MTHLPPNTPLSKPPHPDTVAADNGKIRIGGGFRLPPAEIADRARVRIGGGFRLPAA